MAVSQGPEAPRRYRGHDIVYWMVQLAEHGPDRGIDAFTRGRLPKPAARFACNALLSGVGGGRDVHLRDLARSGIRLYGHLEGIEDGQVSCTDDPPERLAALESGFSKKFAPVIDASIEAAALMDPAPNLPREVSW